MKAALLTLFAVAATTIADAAHIQARSPPQPGSEAARTLLDLVGKGMQSWGLAGAVSPPPPPGGSRSPTNPWGSNIGNVPKLNRPYPHPHAHSRLGTPGNPLGPHKKQGRMYPRRRTCASKRGVRCSLGTTAANGASRYPRLRLNGRGVLMVAFTSLAPHARDVLEAIKRWDNPIGAAVLWFDEAMKDLQEAIGGKPVPEIDGNELKLWLICLFRSENPRYPDPVDKACQRLKNAPAEEQKQQQAIDGLNQVADLCEEVEADPPANDRIRNELFQLCDKFAETLENIVDANAGLILMGEWARARSLNYQTIDESDIVVARDFVQKGALGPFPNQTEAAEIADLYMENMSSYVIVEVEDDGTEVVIDHAKPPAWYELLHIGAAYVPEDREAINEGLELLKDSPYLRLFDREARDNTLPVDSCWDQAGLLAFQPSRWDLIAAGMVYLERKLRDINSPLVCAPCLTPQTFWLLRCGLAIPPEATVR
ncbi:hypothetical protein IF1G_10572 [Cordyceps javanica]|uniref:Heat-labile enterotoxin IIA, A chain n=1 Tax=Cordyceps javanica TaxID=43265 RepID=A0A545VL59_9HYPO|nr:hypothetical protein IF1G_10572 [Cordyceps javanica]TQW02462.1 hypothetical protein IF2G_10062 [Cordyceps javanica]